ncbi:MAG: hypothetical protein DMG42_17830 [Acidobacteria bacterium]|nr:MAG: hypothetical protein DMG42_17830 [Acidobacteriota bacterium]
MYTTSARVARSFSCGSSPLARRFLRHVVCDDGNNNIIYTLEIEYTDFPLNEIKFDFANNVILLLSEY